MLRISMVLFVVPTNTMFLCHTVLNTKYIFFLHRIIGFRGFGENKMQPEKKQGQGQIVMARRRRVRMYRNESSVV